jgi:2-polyprenyl-3-methyl-5-hydroxy-6-metoxy-1,4-benzoquinol methylase
MRNTKTNQLLRKRWARPNKNLLKKIIRRFWTHNIPLIKNKTTTNQDNVLIGDESRTKVIKKNLYTFMGKNNSLLGLKLIDLGCFEGGISFEMAREDMDVVGVEGRISNFKKCKLLQDYFAFPNLKFLNLDVRKISKKNHGIFDVVLCLGLLYHLDNPVSFLNILSDITDKTGLLFLDTHFAPADEEYFNMCKFKDRRQSTSGQLYQMYILSG